MPLFLLFLLGMLTASEGYAIARHREVQKRVKKWAEDPLDLDLEG
jgi:hypothetical protein